MSSFSSLYTYLSFAKKAQRRNRRRKSFVANGLRVALGTQKALRVAQQEIKARR